MKTTSKLFILVFTFMALTASAYAQSPREQLKQMVQQLQKTPTDNSLREKIIKLATSIKPAPAIPEEAREPFVMGATVLKKASDPAGASKAVDLFTQALNIAPWFADAYYNRSIAREAAGQFEPAIDDLKLYLNFKLTGNERREAQDKIYALKADAQLASAKKAEQDKIARAEEAKRQAEQAKRDVITQIKNAVGNRTYELKIPSHSKSAQMAGVSDNELFHGGTYYMFEFEGKENAYYWKFYDDRVELWAYNNSDSPTYVGKSTGSDIKSMRWSSIVDGPAVWGFFNLTRGRLYAGMQKPVDAPEIDPNKRYFVEIYDPK